MKKFVYLLTFTLLFSVTACGKRPQPLKLTMQAPEQSFRAKPVPPLEPDPVLTTPAENINLEATTHIHPFGKKYIPKNASIGVLDFSSSDNSSAGKLVSDTFSIHLHKKGINVVERENIDRIQQEQQMAASGLQDIDSVKLATSIGKILHADYMVFGAVTQYDFENTTLNFPYTIPEDAFEHYQQELRTYKRQANAWNGLKSIYLDKYYAYLEHYFLTQISRNDLNGTIHRKDGKWHYGSFSRLNFRDQTLATEVLPPIGKSEREKKHEERKLQQEKSNLYSEIKRIIDKHENNVTPEEWQNAIGRLEPTSWGQYQKKRHEDFYIQRTKSTIRQIVTRLRKIDEINGVIQQNKLPSIPENKDDFQYPPPENKFTSAANIGFTYKIINVETSKIAWIGQASKRDLSIQEGLNVMIKQVINDMIR